jgi:RNA polymerase sigma factor (sigma-70 family)
VTDQSPIGDGGVFEATYREHAVGLKRVAFLITGSDAAAEDAVHEVFFRCANRLQDIDHPLSYLRRAVVNECRTQHGRDRRRRALSDVRQTEELPHEIVETLDALRTLTDRKRAAIVLRYFVDIPQEEIADILGCRPSTVRSLVRRGLNDLREVLR